MDVSPNSLFNPERRVYRGFLLVGMCFLTFGSYYVYDMPSALQDGLTTRLDMSPFEYSWLYSIYSWPNTFLALIGGFLIDKLFGVRLGAIIFCSLVFVGQFVFAVGIQMENYWVAVSGRFIFGLGGESLSVSQSTYTAKWFTGKELALAFGICLSFARVGSSVNFNLSPFLAEKFGLPQAIWIGVVICLISMVFALLLAFFDLKGEKYRKATGTMPPKSEEKIELSDVKDFPLALWLLVFICITFYISVFLFTQFGGDFLHKKYGLTPTRADTMLSIPSLFSAGASPILGFLVDRIGRSLSWVLGASAVMTCVHLFFNFTPSTGGILFPIIGMLIMGAAYSVCAASLWPCVALLMPPRHLGTAYGLMTALQNLGLAVAPLAVGYVLTVTHKNYLIMEFIFAGSAAAAVGFTILLILLDMAKHRGKLNCSPTRFKQLTEEEESETKPLIINNEERYD